ncbi:condensation domain-containing protein, partial [Plantactinospora endophytica]|uniref:condensation domain-containing protein n=1 Tax=Plantactinospora endophytica TaxID=673535 RepID=UPI0036369F32
MKTQSQYVLSSSQLRLWALSHSKESNVAYNSIGGYVFEGELNYEFLNESLNEVVTRHESLRTVFKDNEEGEVYQIIKDNKDIDFDIEYCDLRKELNIEEELRKKISQDSVVPFDLSTGPLFKTKLYQIGETKWVFIYVIHHIIIDAPSMKIFISEILELYNSKREKRENRLTPLRIQYKDYASWESEQ